jgi:8-oxo-dGTP pyrophosphatase MutT (NUDIX family)
LIRELAEELGIDVAASCLAPFTFAVVVGPWIDQHIHPTPFLDDPPYHRFDPYSL